MVTSQPVNTSEEMESARLRLKELVEEYDSKLFLNFFCLFLPIS